MRFRLSLNGKETPILLNNNELSTVIKIKPGNYDIMVIYEEQDNIDGWGHLLPEHDIESNTISKNLNANMLYEFEFGTYYKQLYLSSDFLLKLTDEFQFE